MTEKSKQHNFIAKITDLDIQRYCIDLMFEDPEIEKLMGLHISKSSHNYSFKVDGFNILYFAEDHGQKDPHRQIISIPQVFGVEPDDFKVDERLYEHAKMYAQSHLDSKKVDGIIDKTKHAENLEKVVSEN